MSKLKKEQEGPLIMFFMIYVNTYRRSKNPTNSL